MKSSKFQINISLCQPFHTLLSGTDSCIYEIYITNSGKFCLVNLTQRANSPHCAGPLCALAIRYPQNRFQSQHVFFQDRFGNIQELAHEPKPSPEWHLFKLFADVSADFGNISGWDYNNHMQASVCSFYSRGKNSHIHEFIWENKWNHFDLTQHLIEKGKVPQEDIQKMAAEEPAVPMEVDQKPASKFYYSIQTSEELFHLKKVGTCKFRMIFFCN